MVLNFALPYMEFGKYFLYNWKKNITQHLAWVTQKYKLLMLETKLFATKVHVHKYCGHFQLHIQFP